MDKELYKHLHEVAKDSAKEFFCSWNLVISDDDKTECVTKFVLYMFYEYLRQTVTSGDDIVKNYTEIFGFIKNQSVKYLSDLEQKKIVWEIADKIDFLTSTVNTKSVNHKNFGMLKENNDFIEKSKLIANKIGAKHIFEVGSGTVVPYSSIKLAQDPNINVTSVDLIAMPEDLCKRFDFYKIAKYVGMDTIMFDDKFSKRFMESDFVVGRLACEATMHMIMLCMATNKKFRLEPCFCHHTPEQLKQIAKDLKLNKGGEDPVIELNNLE